MNRASLVRSYLGLLALLALTVASSFIGLAGWNGAVNLAIAAAKSTIIILVFMEFMAGGPLPRLAALAAGVWLLILFTLTLIDRVVA